MGFLALASRAMRLVTGAAQGFAFARRRHRLQHVDVRAHDEAVRLAGNEDRRFDLLVLLELGKKRCETRR